MYATTSNWPMLPLELIENIISETWALPLTSQERIQFMTSSLLVNKTWMTAFMRTSSTDVHIPSPYYVNRFFSLLRQESCIFDFDENVKSYPRRLIKSISIRVDNDVIHPDSTKMGESPMARALTYILLTLRSIDNIPTLERLSVEYHNYSYDDITNHYRFAYIPSHFSELELNYSYGSQTPPWLVDSLRRSYARSDNLSWARELPFIRRLTITGASQGLVEDVMARCPSVVDIMTDDYIRLDDKSALPPCVKSVVLCRSSSAISTAGTHAGIADDEEAQRNEEPLSSRASSNHPKFDSLSIPQPGLPTFHSCGILFLVGVLICVLT